MVCVNHRTQSHISTSRADFPLAVLPLTTLALSCFLTCAAGGKDCEIVGLSRRNKLLGGRIKAEVGMCLPHLRKFLDPL